jgi:hypothetical protein
MESPGGPKGEIRGPGKLSPFLLFYFLFSFIPNPFEFKF